MFLLTYYAGEKCFILTIIRQTVALVSKPVSVVHLARTLSIMRVVMSSSPD